jgi:hypothetical protein
MKIPMTEEIGGILDRFDDSLNTNFGLILSERARDKFIYKKSDEDTGDSLIFTVHATGIFEICYIKPESPSVVANEGEGIFDFLKRVL